MLGQQANAAATATVSATGRMIDQLLQSARQDGAPAALQGSAPLLKAAQAQAGPIATALRDALVFSGLFYESHVAQWASGKRALPELMREPQAQAEKLAAAVPEPAARQESARPQGAHLITLQLDALENQRVLWRGELWPGQPLEWEIGKEAPQDGREPTSDGEPAWHSVVRFELPQLGTVAASIRLQGQGLQIQLRTETEAAAGALRTHGGQLADALGAAGSPLESLTVRRDESQQ